MFYLILLGLLIEDFIMIVLSLKIAIIYFCHKNIKFVRKKYIRYFISIKKNLDHDINRNVIPKVVIASRKHVFITFLIEI